MVEPIALLHGRKVRSAQDAPISAADPHGLISSFIRCPPGQMTTPNDIFVIWMLRHRYQTTSEAALTILDTYDAAMLQSGSDWVEALRDLFLEISALPAPSGSFQTRGE